MQGAWLIPTIASWQDNSYGANVPFCPKPLLYSWYRTACAAVQITPESTIVLVKSTAPLVKLDDKYYKLVDKMESLVDAPPSLVDAKKLTVKGPVKFGKGVVIQGDVTLSNGGFSNLQLCRITDATTLPSSTRHVESVISNSMHAFSLL